MGVPVGVSLTKKVGVGILLLIFLSIAGCATLTDFSLKHDSAYHQSKRDFFALPETVSPPENSATKEFVLQFFHFNVEYVAGDRKSEDAVVRESFWPVVVMLLRHPNWGADIELQGYMIEVMAERHPEVLRDLQKLASRGKVRLISFHYSDQLVVAFPRHDQEWSHRLNQEIFKKYNLPLSKTVFLQEDQFGEGIMEFSLEKGFRIATTNYQSYFHDSNSPAPFFYEWKDLTIIQRRNISRDGIKATWTFNGDGELLATDGSNPTLPLIELKEFRFHPRVLLDYEKKLLQHETGGNAIVSIEEYVERLKSWGIKGEPLKPTLDSLRGVKGNDYRTLFLWLGINATPLESDLEVRSYNFQTRKLVLAAETFLGVAEREFGLDVGKERKLLILAWKAQLRAEVSDASGTVPIRREVLSGFKKSVEAADLAEKIIEIIKQRLGWSRVKIDPLENTALEMPADPETQPVYEKCIPPLEISTPLLSKIVCKKTSPDVWEIEVGIFNANPLGTIKVSFPRFEETVIYSPALLEDRVLRYELSLFDFKRVYLGLPNGLIGLGKDWYVIKHNEVNHTSVRISKNEPLITFLYKWPWSLSTYKWKFTLIHGSQAEALRLAQKINVSPVVIK